MFAVLTGVFINTGLRRVKKCDRLGKMVQSWSAVILAHFSQAACAHVCSQLAVVQQCLPSVCVGLARVLAYHGQCTRCGRKCAQGQEGPNLLYYREGRADDQPDRSSAPLVVRTCVSQRRCRSDVSGNGEAAQEKFKEGLDLAVRAMQLGPKEAQSYTWAVIFTKRVEEALPLKDRIKDLFKVNSRGMKAAELDNSDAMAQHLIEAQYFDVANISWIQR